MYKHIIHICKNIEVLSEQLESRFFFLDKFSLSLSYSLISHSHRLCHRIAKCFPSLLRFFFVFVDICSNCLDVKWIGLRQNMRIHRQYTTVGVKIKWAGIQAKNKEKKLKKKFVLSTESVEGICNAVVHFRIDVSCMAWMYVSSWKVILISFLGGARIHFCEKDREPPDRSKCLRETSRYKSNHWTIQTVINVNELYGVCSTWIY